jgi:hypothetical protein
MILNPDPEHPMQLICITEEIEDQVLVIKV